MTGKRINWSSISFVEHDAQTSTCKGSEMYKRSLLNALKVCVSAFEDDLDLLAKLIQCLRLPMSKTGTLL
jgi:hypothetical protein